jgi:hypothetical protein
MKHPTSKLSLPELPTLAQLEYQWGTAAGSNAAEFALHVLQSYARKVATAIDEAREEGRREERERQEP